IDVRRVGVTRRDVDEAGEVRERVTVAGVVVTVVVPAPVVDRAVVRAREAEVDLRAEFLVEVDPQALASRPGVPLDPLLAAHRARGVIARGFRAAAYIDDRLVGRLP